MHFPDVMLLKKPVSPNLLAEVVGKVILPSMGGQRTNTRLTPSLREPQIMQPVLRRLASLAPLSPEEERAVQNLGRRIEEHSPNTSLLTESNAVKPRFVISGWAARQRLLPDGRRQIFSLVLPGDAIGLCPQLRPLAAASTVALTRMTTVDAVGLVDALDGDAAYDNLLTAVRRQAALDEALLLDHVVRLGRQTAYERVAHLLLELQGRLVAIGLTDTFNFTMPLTQECLADVLGLSIVHVNRILQQLRREKMIMLAGFRVSLLEPELLAAIADYKAPQTYAF